MMSKFSYGQHGKANMDSVRVAILDVYCFMNPIE